MDEVNTFGGFGAVTCNNTSRLLPDCKEDSPQQYWEMMRLLFDPQGGAGLHHIKIEMGGDVNSSSGTEPATMRSYDEEPNVKRGAGFPFAADAKTINPDITVELLRWGEPKYLKNDEEFRELVDVISDHYAIHLGSADLTKLNQEDGIKVICGEAIAPMINANYRYNVQPEAARLRLFRGPCCAIIAGLTT